MLDEVDQTQETVFRHISKHKEKGVESMTRSGVFLTRFEVFGNASV